MGGDALDLSLYPANEGTEVLRHDRVKVNAQPGVWEPSAPVSSQVSPSERVVQFTSADMGWVTGDFSDASRKNALIA